MIKQLQNFNNAAQNKLLSTPTCNHVSTSQAFHDGIYWTTVRLITSRPLLPADFFNNGKNAE